MHLSYNRLIVNSKFMQQLTSSNILDHLRLVSELILFTRNRPMQTLAFIESLSHIASGLDKIWVLLRADTQDFQNG